jgi:hypothetical protein
VELVFVAVEKVEVVAGSEVGERGGEAVTFVGFRVFFDAVIEKASFISMFTGIQRRRRRHEAAAISSIAPSSTSSAGLVWFEAGLA